MYIITKNVYKKRLPVIEKNQLQEHTVCVKAV
jgi:hypothetical protein